MSFWIWIGVGGIVLALATGYLTRRARQRNRLPEQPANTADDAVGQGLINTLLDILLP